MIQDNITVKATYDSLKEISNFIHNIMECANISTDIVFQMDLVVEEAVTNIIKHGYREDNGSISINAEIDNEKITFSISDHAKPFNPLSIPPPDIDLNLDERQIGGLGVHLIRSMMTEVGYEYKDGVNTLHMVRKI